MAKVNSAIGIEYNSHEIKAVELTKGSDGLYNISAFGKETLDSNVMGNGIIVDNSLFSVALNELMERNKFNRNLSEFSKYSFLALFCHKIF